MIFDITVVEEIQVFSFGHIEIHPHVTIVRKMREQIPELALRTTFITGFPTETEKDYQTLLDFVAEIRFDHMGVFPYSFELGTSGAALGDPIPADDKTRRVEGLMKLQETISMERNQRLIGKSLDVLVEGYGDDVNAQKTEDALQISGLPQAGAVWKKIL